MAAHSKNDLKPITSADEFFRLRTSSDPGDYERASWAPATDSIWFEIIDRWPEMRFWVAHNRTAPIAVLERLVRDHDEQVRLRLAQRRKLPDHLRELLATDSDEAVVAENARRWTDQK